MLKKKKPQTGTEELHEVKNAGFKATKKIKRDKTVNRRAGLHDKLNSENGEVRVKRRKPLALKHVRRMRKFAAVGAVAVVGAISVVGVGFFMQPGTVASTEDRGNPSVCFEPPTDGTKPTDCTLVENVGYLTYVLKNQPYWSSHSKTNVFAAAGDTYVDNYKQYYNNVLISSDISISSLSVLFPDMQYGEQFCQPNMPGTKYQDRILSRYSSSTKKEELEKGTGAPWSTGKAAHNYSDLEEFRSLRGLPPLDFSVYVLTENTIANAYDTDVVDNGDGTYTMTLELVVNVPESEDEDGEIAGADYYYKVQMWANGNLNEEPIIYTTTLTYTFDASWRVLQLDVDDYYHTRAKGIDTDCTSHTTTTYSYKEEDAKNTFWEDYFKAEFDRTENSKGEEENNVAAPSGMEYVVGAFGSVITEGGIFKIDLSIDDLNLSGVVCLDLSDGIGVTAKLGDILVWLDGNALYIDDGSSKYMLDMSVLQSADGEENEGKEEQSLLDSLNLDALLEQLGAGEFILDEETGAATFECALELFGIKINLFFDFQKTEDAVELNYLQADVTLGEKVVNATLRFGDESDKPAIPEDTSAYQDILNDGVTLAVSLNAGGFTLDGIAKIIMSNGEFAGLYADLGDITVYYDCPPNMLYLSVGDVKYKLDLSAFDAGDADFSAMLGSFDINSLLSSVLANLSATENSIGSGLEIEAFGSLINAALDIRLLGGLGVDANITVDNLKVTLGATLGNEEVVLPDLTGYRDILNDEITLDVSLTLMTGLTDEETGKRDEVTLEGKVAIVLDGGAVTEIRADFGGLAVYFDFTAQELYLKVGTTKVMINLGDMELNDLSLLSSTDGGDFLADVPTIIKELLTNLVGDGKIISTSASVFNGLDPVWAQLDLSDGINVSAEINILGIDALIKAGISDVALDGLSDEEKEEYTDVLKEGLKIIESLIGDHISATVTGTLYSYEEKYAETDNVKYTFTASLEFDTGAATDWVSADNAYIHLNIGLTAKNADDDSLFIDLYLMDANPVTGSDGKTTGGYTTDGNYDIFLSVSNRSENPVPLKIYAPVDEILTLVSMAGAAVNLDAINVRNSEELTAIIGQISDVLDGMLISQYLPKSVQDKFASLGDSLIPQIWGVNLSELLEKLIANVDDTVEEVEKTEISLSDKYVSGIKTTDESLIFVLNSSLIYNNENLSADDNLTVVFDRVLNDGVYYVGGVGLKNIYFGDDLENKLNIDMRLNYGEVARPDAGNAFGGYLNADGLDTLVNGIINSATHKIEGTDDEYDLNHYYLLNGKITAGISVIGFINVNAVIDIKSVAVYIDENNEVSVDAHIYYDGVSELNQTAIDGDSDVYISISGNRIIVKRVKYTHYVTKDVLFWQETEEVTYDTPLVEVRAMTLKEFSADLMDNLTFIFSFGPVITDNIANAGSDNAGVSFEGMDFGECLNTVISSYVYSESSTGASWTVSLNGGLVEAYTGMSTSDISVRFNADLNDDGTYTVKSLDILETTMKLFGSVVTLNISGGITYCNPNEVMGEGFVDTSVNLFAINSTVNSAFGLGENYVQSESGYTLNGVVECGTQVKLPLSVVGESNGQLYMLDGYYVNGGNVYYTFDGTVVENGTVYGLATITEDTVFTAVWNKVYTVTYLGVDGEELYSVNYHENEVLSAQNMPAVPELHGYSGEWYGAAGTTVDGNLSFTLKYSINTYAVTFIDGDRTTVIERLFGSSIGLNELDTNTALALNFYDADGNIYDEITVRDNETYYVNSRGKTFTVVYESDVAFDGSALDTYMQFGDGSDYLSAAISTEYGFLGWFIQNGESYKYVSDVNVLKNFLAESDFVDGSTVTLNAVWYSNLTVNITTASRTNLGIKYWTIGGNYSGGDILSGMSSLIAEKAGLTSSVQIRYELNDSENDCDGEECQDKLNSGSWYTPDSDKTFQKKSMTCTNGSAYGGVRVKVTFTVDGVNIPVEKSAYKHY